MSRSHIDLTHEANIVSLQVSALGAALGLVGDLAVRGSIARSSMAASWMISVNWKQSHLMYRRRKSRCHGIRVRWRLWSRCWAWMGRWTRLGKQVHQPAFCVRGNIEREQATHQRWRATPGERSCTYSLRIYSAPVTCIIWRMSTVLFLIRLIPQGPIKSLTTGLKRMTAPRLGGPQNKWSSSFDENYVASHQYSAY